jgi:exodeoxyribonuclease VII small subunit
MEREDASFEDRLSRLEEIVQRLEADAASLEEGVALYREGSTLVKSCLEELENARREVRQVEAGLQEGESSDDKERQA